MSPEPGRHDQTVVSEISGHFRLFLRNHQNLRFMPLRPMFIFAGSKRTKKFLRLCSRIFMLPVVCNPGKPDRKCVRGTPDIEVEIFSPRIAVNR